MLELHHRLQAANMLACAARGLPSVPENQAVNHAARRSSGELNTFAAQVC